MGRAAGSLLSGTCELVRTRLCHNQTRAFQSDPSRIDEAGAQPRPSENEVPLAAAAFAVVGRSSDSQDPGLLHDQVTDWVRQRTLLVGS
jgi:hypothetical protein